MKRRIFLAAAGVATLAGCGFQLRQAPAFAFDSIYIQAPPTSPIAHELRRNLASGNSVRVLNNATEQANARVILEVPLELREKVVVGLNSTGQVREFQLRSRIRFKLRTPDGRELIPETELLQQRDISFNEGAVLAKEAEETLLYRDMQTDLVQQLMRRLAALKGV
ncbi:MAG TPA: LPS assembly lipoprotein LptE [Ramlibacter sp.]|jgi:LPS-assembly lipoprotein|nr:LPS assembly lipoprotein LptE [Ramlibacter sp.]